jgi:glycosyltransferase involved in cell wall biosynthesis
MKMCQAMKQEGHEPILFCLQDKEDNSSAIWNQYGIFDRFSIMRTKTRSQYGYIFWALAALRKYDIDMVYTRSVNIGAICSLLGYRTVCELHDLPAGKFGPLWFRVFLIGLKKGRVIVITNALRSALAARYGKSLPEEFVRVAPDAVDLERFEDLPSAEFARQKLNIREQFTVGYAGHFYAGRGIDLILELSQTMPHVQFSLMGGRPEDVKTYEELIDRLSLQNITLHGFVANEELPLYLSACDVLLMPYQNSVAVSGGGNTAQFFSPMKLFEYMAAERLIISSNLPVLCEILNISNSVLLPFDDIQLWRKAIERALSDRNWRLSLGRQARTDVEKHTWRLRVTSVFTDMDHNRTDKLVTDQ